MVESLSTTLDKIPTRRRQNFGLYQRSDTSRSENTSFLESSSRVNRQQTLDYSYENKENVVTGNIDFDTLKTVSSMSTWQNESKRGRNVFSRSSIDQSSAECSVSQLMSKESSFAVGRFGGKKRAGFPILKSKLNASLVEFFLQDDGVEESSFDD